MAKSLKLVYLCKTPEGWRRFPLVIGRNGRIKKGAVLIDGVEHVFPGGHYEIRSFSGRKQIYQNVGDDPTAAQNALIRETAKHEAKEHAQTAGVRIVEEEQRKTIRAASKRWVEDTLARGAKSAAHVNQVAMREFLGANPGLEFVDEIEPQHLTRFHNVLREAGKADRTVYNQHLRITGFLRYADVNYQKWRLRAPRFEKKIPDCYSEEQVEALLTAAKSDESRLLIKILANTGLRDQELQHLEWPDINLKTGVLKVQGKPGWNIKDFEQREIPLPDSLVNALEEWKKKQQEKSTKRKGNKLVLPSRTGSVNKKYLKLLDTVAGHAGIDGATLHRFRRTYGTNLLRGGVDLRTVQSLLGHSDLESTMRYLTPATGDEVKKKVRAVLK
jgi:integrase